MQPFFLCPTLRFLRRRDNKQIVDPYINFKFIKIKSNLDFFFVLIDELFNIQIISSTSLMSYTDGSVFHITCCDIQFIWSKWSYNFLQSIKKRRSSLLLLLFLLCIIFTDWEYALIVVSYYEKLPWFKTYRLPISNINQKC